jgi:hypothetical protein
MTDDARKHESNASFTGSPQARGNSDEHASPEDIEAHGEGDHVAHRSDIMARIWSWGMPAYALADRFVGSDAVAMAVRNIGPRFARIVIVNAAVQDDCAILSAEAALRMDELQEFAASGRRIISIFGDGRMNLRTFDESGVGVVNWRRYASPIYSGADQMRRLRRLTAGVAPETMPGIGIIRVAPPRSSAAWLAVSAWIDQYHAEVCRVAAEMVRANPLLLDQARESVKAWTNIAPSPMRDGIRAWDAILSRKPDEDTLTAVLDTLLAQGPQAVLLHRTSPFSAMVSPATREEILRKIDTR